MSADRGCSWVWRDAVSHVLAVHSALKGYKQRAKPAHRDVQQHEGEPHLLRNAPCRSVHRGHTSMAPRTCAYHAARATTSRLVNKPLVCPARPIPAPKTLLL